MLHRLHQPLPTPAAKSRGSFRCIVCHNVTGALAESSPRSVRRSSLPPLLAPYFSFSHTILCFFGFLALIEQLSSPSRELCFYLLVAGVPSTASDTIMISGTSASRSGSSLHSPFSIFCLFPGRPFRQISWWCPRDSLQPFCFFFLILVHPQVMFFSRYLQGFICFSEHLLFMSSIIRSCILSPALSCTLSFPSIHSGKCLVFCSAFVFRDFCLDTFFQVDQPFPLRFPSGPASNT